MPDKLRNLITLGRYEDYGGDRSAAVFACACWLVRERIGIDDGADVLLNPAYKISEHCLEQGQTAKAHHTYALRQMRSAHKKVKATKKTRDLTPDDGRLYLDQNAYHPNAKEFIKRKYFVENEITLLHYQATFYGWETTHYAEIPAEGLWLRRALGDLNTDLFKDKTLDGAAECVVDEARGQDRGYFEQKLAAALAEGRRVVHNDGIGCVVFAHKTTEGWEALLSGFIRSGWVITGSWPIQTEMGARLRAMNSAALGASVHLICRPRPDNAGIGDWADVLRELPNRVGDWMERLQGEGVRGADLVFACIGPALEIFSRYAKVESAEGRNVELAEYLAKVWEVVGRSALAQVLGTAEAKARNGAAGAFEEDARLTALFLWTLQSTNGIAAEDAGNDREDEGAVDEEEEAEETSRGKAKGFTLVST